MTPVTDAAALNMFVIHALRDFSRQQHETNATLNMMQTEIRTLTEQMIRWENNVKRIEKLENEIEALVNEQQRRAGMRWLLEWLSKHVPWMVAVAAAILALKIGYNPRDVG